MSPRLRIAASVLALAAAWWLGMLAERSRHGASEGAVETGAPPRPPDDDLTARAAELRAARENAAAFPDHAPAPPRDLAARFEAARHAPTQILRLRRLTIATSDLSAEEIPNVLALALSMRSTADKDEKDTLRLGALSRWAELDPSAAAAYTIQLLATGEIVDDWTLTSVIGEWGTHDPAAAADFVATIKDRRREPVIFSLLTGVAASEPETALALLSRFPEAVKDSWGYDAIFGAWSDRDPRSAAARAESLSAGDSRETALSSVAEHWARQDRRTAYAWAAQLDDPTDRQMARKTILYRWAEDDPQSAASLTLGLDDITLLRGISSRVAYELANSDLPAAQRFAARLTDDVARAAAQQMVVVKMAYQNVADAAAYVSGMTEGEDRQEALYQLSARWVEKDPMAAAQWLGTLSASRSRDSAVRAYVEHVAQQDPENALAWAVSLSEGDRRTESITRAYQAWWKQSPKAAQAWLDAHHTLLDDLRSEPR